MTDRPVIMSAPMVRALLDGRKTQTRRLAWAGGPKVDGGLVLIREARKMIWQSVRPGHRLWVRELHPYTESASRRTRRASRITLDVTAVRIERLQDITETDAKAEGATAKPCPRQYDKAQIGWSMDWPATEPDRGWNDVCLGNPRMAFANYWIKLHGLFAWQNNPEVVVLTFTVRLANIDATLPPPPPR